jgi:hypothetical protein
MNTGGSMDGGIGPSIMVGWSGASFIGRDGLFQTVASIQPFLPAAWSG